VSFIVPAEKYDRLMGHYSAQLAGPLADLAGVQAGQRVLDVGCGPGALTAELVARVGPDAVCAVDPSPPFVAANRERHPGVAVSEASAEALPFDDDTFDAALAQLVVHFMADPVAGLREMARVTRPGGAVVASVWDHADSRSPVSALWRAAHALGQDPDDESGLAGARRGHLAELFAEAGLREVEQSDQVVAVTWSSFEAWWEPFTYGIGPAGQHVMGLDESARQALHDRTRAEVGPPPFTITAAAWVARGVA
jgi:SAM-dependent methyltransferase